MKPAHLALAAVILCLCGSDAAISQEATTPAVANGAPTEGGDDADLDLNVGDSVGDTPRPGPVQKAAPFKELPGRWVGEGRIGMREGKVESVKCRATYFVNDAGDELNQNIRCASAGGKVEVKSNVVAKDGKVSGRWNELVYNLGGDFTGEVTQRGFRIVVRGGDLTANMDVIVMADKQMVEIQFFNSSLRGLTLILEKG